MCSSGLAAKFWQNVYMLHVSPFTKIIYNPDLPLNLFGAVSQRYLRSFLSDYSCHFAPNKTSLITLMLYIFSTWHDISKTCYFNLLFHAQTLLRCFTNRVPKTFFILLNSHHKWFVTVKNIKAACFGHFLSLVSMRSPCERNKMRFFSLVNQSSVNVIISPATRTPEL